MNASATSRSSENLSRFRRADPAAREVADTLEAYLIEGGGEDLSAVLDLDVKNTRLVLDPSLRDLPFEELKSVLRYWRDLPRSGGIPEVLKVDPDRLIAALGYIMLVDLGEAEDDSGFDMTGKSIWDIPTTSDVQVFLAACYMAARRLKRPLYSVHEAPPMITVSHWHRLILPLGKAGKVRRFLVCNVPISEGKPR